MKYLASEGKLLTDDGRMIKELDCPLNKEWDNLTKLNERDSLRRCGACSRNVLDISSLCEEQVVAIVGYDPQVCVHVRSDSEYIEWIDGVPYSEEDKPITVRSYETAPCDVRYKYFNKCRVIKTARSIDEINLAKDEGLNFVMKKVQGDPKFHSKMAILQDPETKSLYGITDYREEYNSEDVVLDFFSYRTDSQESPFAAYLVPKDIVQGERVYILDLIENIEVANWNQGDAYRQQRGYATWNGSGFDIEPVEVRRCVG